jgi:outer membrane protein OmpA-like peptidoglycan-associated protein
MGDQVQCQPTHAKCHKNWRSHLKKEEKKMNQKFIRILLVFLLLPFTALAADQAAEQPVGEELQVIGPEQAAKVSFQTMEDGNLLVSVTDAEENPIKGLTADQFSIRKGLKTAKILSFEPLATKKEIGLNIVMIIDNSLSMKMRNAVNPLTEALEAFYKTLRPIDQVYAVVFDDRQTTDWGEQKLHARMLKTSDVPVLRTFVNQSLTDGLTDGTYLYDAMIFGLQLARSMPEKSNKFMVVFTDGKDLNSSVKKTDVEKQTSGIANFSAYAVDYMPSSDIDKFLSRFTQDNNGRIWKASSATELLPVFEAFSSTLLHRYVVAYHFLEAPSGTVAFSTPELTIEEVTTIDSAPMLNYVFFDTLQSELGGRYNLLKNRQERDAFQEEKLRGALEKYRNVLNIIGKRLKDNPGANLRLVGCNSNISVEQGRTDISLQRAESVRAYLRYVWGINPSRLSVEHRNLPEAPSSNSTAEGRMENQRVEFYSDHPAILATVNSEYVQNVTNLEQLQIIPEISSEAGIADWKVTLDCGERTLQVFEGTGDLPGKLVVPLEAALLEKMTACNSVRSTVHAVDKETNVLDGDAAQGILPVRFLQRKEQMAQVQGYKVKEQYALILFDYNRADIKGRNQAIVARIVGRIAQVPDALISVVGHTDILGKESYNMELSRRRAEAVQTYLLQSAPQLAGKLHVSGVGPHDPLFDNQLPEGRSLNRTVTITLEYLQNQQQ